MDSTPHTYLLQLIDRTTAVESTLKVEAFSEEEARVIASSNTDCLIGAIKIIGRPSTSKVAKAANKGIDKSERINANSNGQSRAPSIVRWKGFGVLFIVWSGVLLIYATVLNVDVNQEYREEKQRIKGRYDYPINLFKSDNAIGATANYVQHVENAVNRSTEIIVAMGMRSEGMMTVMALRGYAGILLMISVMCFAICRLARHAQPIGVSM